MEVFLTILRYAAGPILGAAIGFFTNWLAVKMLFRPYYPKKIGKWQLPFTPGIIPKRKGALAKAVGKAVGEQLLTQEDLAKAITSEPAKENFCNFVVEKWQTLKTQSVEEVSTNLTTADRAQEVQGKMNEAVANRVFGAVSKVDWGELVATEGVKLINAKRSSLGMISMFLTDDLVSSLAEKLADGVNNYVQTNGKELVDKAVAKEMQSITKEPLGNMTKYLSDETVKKVAGAVYEGAVLNVVKPLAASVNVSEIVEQKINDMDVKELEKLVLSVMKKELNAIINLGALIGFILGIVMIFV
jgi:uncharacterized membrane protein YheB (UPF0754 family)